MKHPTLARALRTAMAASLAALPSFVVARTACPQVVEQQTCADLGDGRYQNPVLGGDFPDPSVLRVGNDYYMTHSSFDYVPGLLVWHSRDLVHWEPVTNALRKYVGSVWAPDLVKHGERYYIYFPAGRTNWVVWAPAPEGPWSDPLDLKVPHIDPGHVVGPDGTRYLHLSGGHAVQLAPDGLSTVGEVRKVYDAWPIPEDWVVECECLESPKLTVHGGYYYLTVAEGGTAGPATSHMIISARSRSPLGPWEQSPYNPVVHTRSRQERWWSRGHGSLVDTPQGDWWILYHAYDKGFYNLGRQTLMEPIEWTADGWFRIRPGVNAGAPIPKPAGAAVIHGQPLSDAFAGPSLGLQWRAFREAPGEWATVRDGALDMTGRGTSLADSSLLTIVPVNESYEVQVEVVVQGGAQAGLVVFYDRRLNGGVTIDAQRVFRVSQGVSREVPLPRPTGRAFLKLVNDRHEVSTYVSADGQTWTRIPRVLEVSGWHHNVAGGFLGLRVGLSVSGPGSARFDNFKYRGLDHP